jgi:hypothetical protein
VVIQGSPAEIVRASVARADRLRRGRETSRRLWRAAPAAAAICAGVAAGARWAGWSSLLPLGILGIGTVALAGYAYAARRDRAISDAAAADIDARGGFGGELRSAAWFAARLTQDPWIDFHLARAADRLQAMDWTGLYPAVRAPRAKAAAALLAIGALALALTVRGGRDTLHASGSAAAAAFTRGRTPASASSVALAPDITKQLEELLEAAEKSAATAAGSALSAADVRDLLSRLARAQDLRRGKDPTRGQDAAGDLAALIPEDLKGSAERVRRASEMTSLSPDVRAALGDVAQKLSDMADARDTSPKDPRDAAGAAEAQHGQAAQSNRDSNKEDAAIQAVKDASAGGGIGVIMMSDDRGPMAPEPGLGLGGGSAKDNGRGRMADIGAALRRETLEAHADAAGENLPTELRRRTERADATVAYVHTAPVTFDRGRATARPALPESRRAAVQTYFIRKP